MRRTGFTLVELLLVIAIIAVLAALLIPLIGFARNASKNAKCESQLATIKAGLALYKDANGFYPEKYLRVAADPSSDVYTTTFKRSGAYVTADAVGSTGWKAIAEALLEQLQTVDRDNFTSLKALQDPFTTGGVGTNVFRYRPAKFYPLLPYDPMKKPEDNPRWIDADGRTTEGTQLPPNPDTFQLWSAGIDGKDQFGDRVNGRKSDDVTNWKTP